MDTIKKTVRITEFDKGIEAYVKSRDTYARWDPYTHRKFKIISIQVKGIDPEYC